MSLIITYIGSNGCVMAGDKRRIGFFGPESHREQLEEALYSGKIKNIEELQREAEKHGITLKISDDAEKLRAIDSVLVGEVRSRSTVETKRKRIYATTGAYNMVELLGSEIKTVKSGGSSIVVFGNKYTQELAETSLKKKWKSKLNILDVEKIFEEVMGEVAIKTPSVSSGFDIMRKHPSLNTKAAKELLRSTIIADVKELENWRNQLKEELIKSSQNIQMASKIVVHGNIGRVTRIKNGKIGIVLDSGIEALDTEWELVAKPAETIELTAENINNIKIGDLVVIENENLCIQRNKEPLICEFIICKSD